ncbi:hypothetical protein, partial [Aeromonas caviae]|uniref:hypothetical protein n=1 Tax=Aeromonas caviae TaxID=648 RepID=UPI002B48BFCF
FPLNYAPFQRNGAANTVLAEHVKPQTKFGAVSERLPTDEVGKMHAQRAPKATSSSKNLVRCPSG